MFNFLLYKPDADVDGNKNSHQSAPVLAAIVLGASLLAGCQQQSTPEENTVSTDEQMAAEDEKPAPQSDSAAAHIKQLQPVYLAQMQSLQRRLQAEYESLQAADMTTNADDLLLNNASNAANTNDTETVNAPLAPNTTMKEDSSSADADIKAVETDSDAKLDAGANSEASTDTEMDLNSSTEVGKRDLTVLRRISAEPREATILTEKQIINSYQQTIAALYQPISEPLSSEETDTLINIAALVPQLFEHTELADRLNAKSPALARLIVQHQVWEQIEARQASYMQEMKLVQQQEFESLMTKFNDTIEDYDKQIAKYEQTLKEFQ